MRIQDLIFLPVKPASTPGPNGGQDNFAQCLKEAVSLRGQAEGPSALGGPALVTATAPNGQTNAAAEMVDTVLCRLELLQEGLARPGLALKSLAPLAQALEVDSQRLQSLAQALPGDSPLTQVVKEAAALTWTESFKFKRGDYL